jgi:hypothetical protein
MWVMLSDCFFSIVSKGCARDELLVRARRKGDIEKLWPAAKVEQTKGTDYAFRAVVSRRAVGDAMVGEVQRINYGNFKDSVDDPALHGAYLRVWTAMGSVQATPPYGSSLFWHDAPQIAKKKRARKLRGKGR